MSIDWREETELLNQLNALARSMERIAEEPFGYGGRDAYYRSQNTWGETEEAKAEREKADAVLELAAAQAKTTPEYLEYERRHAEIRQRWDRVYRWNRAVLAGVPRHHVDAVIDGAFDANKRAMLAVREFLAGEHRLLVLAGGVGTGKTMASAWLAAKIAEVRGRKVEMITAPGLARVSVYKEDEVGPLERCDLLIVDDVGTEFLDTKGMFLTQFDSLMNERYANDRRTVITTNLTAKAFSERYGERLIDRVRESGRFVEIAGESMRRKP